MDMLIFLLLLFLFLILVSECFSFINVKEREREGIILMGLFPFPSVLLGKKKTEEVTALQASSLTISSRAFSLISTLMVDTYKYICDTKYPTRLNSKTDTK